MKKAIIAGIACYLAGCSVLNPPVPAEFNGYRASDLPGDIPACNEIKRHVGTSVPFDATSTWKLCILRIEWQKNQDEALQRYQRRLDESAREAAEIADTRAREEKMQLEAQEKASRDFQHRVPKPYSMGTGANLDGKLIEISSGEVRVKDLVNRIYSAELLIFTQVDGNLCLIHHRAQHMIGMRLLPVISRKCPEDAIVGTSISSASAYWGVKGVTNYETVMGYSQQALDVVPVELLPEKPKKKRGH